MSANQKDAKPIYLWVDREAGHGQGKPLASRIRESVDLWSFLMSQTGLCNPVSTGASAAVAPVGTSKN